MIQDSKIKLKVLGTGSSGNCYLLETETETLIIECGVKFSIIKKSMNFDFTKIVGCIITHEHNDHSLSINELIDSGVEVYATAGTLKGKGISSHFAHVMKKWRSIKLASLQ